MIQKASKVVRSLFFALALVGLALPALAMPARAQVDATTVQGDSDAFVEATVDIADPWVGQQVTYTFRYYEAQDTARFPSILSGAPDYKAPAFSNFWVEGEIDQTSYQVESSGRPYDVSELHTTIFPTVAGEMVIDPAQLILSDLPQMGERILATSPVLLNVRPLPDGAPDTFSGAVGDFRLTADVDRTSTRLDEPISLRLTLSGRGNIGIASPPALPELPGWRVLESDSDVTVDTLDGQIGGVRTWEYQLIPTEVRGVEIPSLEYLFFDLASESYKGSLTEPIALTVEGSPDPAGGSAAAQQTAPMQAAPKQAPAAAAQSQPAAAPALPTAVTAAPQTATSSAAVTGTSPAAPALMAVSGALSVVELTEQPWFWALWALPALAVVVTLGATVSERRSASRRQKRELARAGHDAVRALSAGAATPGDAAAQCAAAQRVLADYLGRKLGRPVSGLTRSGLGTLLAQRGVQPALAGEVLDCYGQCESARYNPAGTNDQAAAALQQRVQTLIRSLDKVL